MVSFKTIEFNKKEPMYPQLSNFIKKQILAGNLKNYEELPSRRELALLLSINPNTVQKAYKQLEEEGLIKTINNVKSVILVDDEIVQAIKQEFIEETFKRFTADCKGNGLDFQQTIALLTTYWSN